MEIAGIQITSHTVPLKAFWSLRAGISFYVGAIIILDLHLGQVIASAAKFIGVKNGFRKAHGNPLQP
jgi:hypothetical protein